jgi:hypothetical protein
VISGLQIYFYECREEKEKDLLEDLCIDGRVILQWILKKYDCRLWAGMI